MSKITLFDRHKIIILHQQGHPQREINRQTGFSRCGIQAVVEKFQISGHIEDKKRRGRPKKLSVWDEQFLKATSSRDRNKSNKDLAQHLADSSGPKVDSSTVQRNLIRNGLNGREQPRIYLSGKGTGKRGWNMQKLTMIGIKINGNKYFGVMNQSSSFLGPVVHNMWEEWLVRGTIMCACNLQWNAAEGL